VTPSTRGWRGANDRDRYEHPGVCPLESPSVVILNPAEHFWPILTDVARIADAKGNILFDAQIVAVCREHGVREILSEDRDFSRFEGVTLHAL
jgi:hypothetical protein